MVTHINKINYRPTRVEINLSALKKNLSQVKAFAPKSKILAIIKANGYGHGIIRVAQELASADGFGVASIDEGIKLRQNGFLHPILLLEGIFAERELELVFHHRLEMVVHSFYQLDYIESFIPSLKHAQFTIWIKIDTGMNRLGFSFDDMPNLINRLSELNIVLGKFISINWLSHFSSTESSPSFTNKQIKEFQDLTKNVDGEKSLANSAGITLFPKSHLDWVRPGIMLYGAESYKNYLPKTNPVMSFYSKVISLKWIEKGVKVGYDHTWIADRKTLLAVVTVGYGDGYPRHAKNGTPVLIDGEIVPLVGRVSMDIITVDVTDIEKTVCIGSDVTLWGKGLAVDKVASFAGTISYELLCGITERVPKIEIKDD